MSEEMQVKCPNCGGETQFEIIWNYGIRILWGCLSFTGFAVQNVRSPQLTVKHGGRRRDARSRM
jgi:uncharacterized Zn finger protein